jgi:dihydrofolate reductase
MGKVIAQASMSLDGFIADTTGQAGPLHDWYYNGDTEVAGTDFRTSAASAEYLHGAWPVIGADVIGRRLFDLTNGWHGRPAVGDHVFVVTHQPPADWPYPDAPFTFVTDGLHSAMAQAQAVAGGRDVSITPGNIAGQAFQAGLIDEIRVDLVPVVLGAGVRYFGDYAGSPLLFDDPQIIQGDRVTHLHYRLRKT